MSPLCASRLRLAADTFFVFITLASTGPPFLTANFLSRLPTDKSLHRPRSFCLSLSTRCRDVVFFPFSWIEQRTFFSHPSSLPLISSFARLSPPSFLKVSFPSSINTAGPDRWVMSYRSFRTFLTRVPFSLPLGNPPPQPGMARCRLSFCYNPRFYLTCRMPTFPPITTVFFFFPCPWISLPLLPAPFRN